MPSRNIVLFKYHPPERVDVLQRRTIYLAHPAVFNDPFELLPYFQKHTSGLDDGSTESAQLFVESVSSLPLRMEILREVMRPQREQHRLAELHKHTLVFSTSHDGDNILLWGHYASGHTGFAVGFKSGAPSFHQRLDGASRNLRRVNYTYLRPAVDTVDELREQEILLTKSSHWQYEKEWRMFESPFNADENNPVKPGVWGFRLEPDSVERVVLGARINADTKDRIVSALTAEDFRHVHLIQAYLVS